MALPGPRLDPLVITIIFLTANRWTAYLKSLSMVIWWSGFSPLTLKIQFERLVPKSYKSRFSTTCRILYDLTKDYLIREMGSINCLCYDLKSGAIMRDPSQGSKSDSLTTRLFTISSMAEAVIIIQRGVFQKENILKQSFALFKRNGYQNTTTREIAMASGINKGLLHYYYQQKDDILIEMYRAILSGLNDFVKEALDPNTDGLVHFAIFNLLFFRTMTGRAYFSDILSEMIFNKNLTRIKITNAVELAGRIIKTHQSPFTDYQLLLAITAAVGAESELLYSIRESRIKMTYDKLVTTINKLLFTMLKVNEDTIKAINAKALDMVKTIDLDSVYEYLETGNNWMQD